MHDTDQTLAQQIAALTPYQQAVLETAACGIYAVLQDTDPSRAGRFAHEMGDNPTREQLAASMYRWLHTHTQ